MILAAFACSQHSVLEVRAGTVSWDPTCPTLALIWQTLILRLRAMLRGRKKGQCAHKTSTRRALVISKLPAAARL